MTGPDKTVKNQHGEFSTKKMRWAQLIQPQNDVDDGKEKITFHFPAAPFFIYLFSRAIKKLFF
jgi:hypothetical protein